MPLFTNNNFKQPESASRQDSDPTLTLNLSALDKKVFASYRVTFEKIKTEELASLLTSFLSEFEGFQFEFTDDSDPDNIRLFRRLIMPGQIHNLLKVDLVKLYVLIGVRIENVAAIAKSKVNLRKTWEAIVLNDFVYSTDIENILGRAIDFQSNKIWFASTMEPEVIFALVEAQKVVKVSLFGSSGNSYKMSLNPPSRRMLAELMGGALSLNPICSEKLPEDEKYVIEGFESDITADMYFLKSLPSSTFEFNSKGTISPVRFREIRKMDGTKEFPNHLETYPLDRIELLITAYALYVNNSKKGKGDLKAFAKFIVKELPGHINSVRFAMFLPEYVGFSKSWASESQISAINEFINAFLIKGGSNWQSTSNLRLRLNSASSRKTYGPRVELFHESRRMNHHLRHSNESSYARIDNWAEQIDMPFILHWMRFLCGMGLLEIAFDLKPEERTENEGIRWVRLTPLGRYALGFNSTYAVQQFDDDSMVDFDDRNLIISLSSTDHPFRMLLDIVAERISATRFRLTIPALMSGCKTTSELETRIKSLSDIANPKENPRLKQFFNEAKKRANIAKQDNTTYQVYSLRTDLPQIAQLFSSDPILRGMCLLAEGGKILVRDDKVNNLKEYLLKLGYMLN